MTWRLTIRRAAGGAGSLTRGRRLATLVATLAMASAPGAVFAQEEAAAGSGPLTGALIQDPSHHDDGRRTVARLPANLFRGAFGVFSTDNLGPLLVGGTATGAGAAFDERFAEAVADPEHRFGRYLESGGRPLWSATGVALVFVVGRFAGGDRFRAASYDWLNAFLINGGYTGALKELVGRQRPNGEDNKSFPSGHASNAFALATVAERHFGWRVAIPAYGLAAAVALSRPQRGKHYLSDVMAGATLGYIVGRTVVRVNSRGLAPASRARIDLVPALSRRTRALAVHVVF